MNCAVLVACLIVVETLFGGWLSKSHYGFLNIPRNVDRVFDVGSLYSGGEAVRYRRDQHGLRGAYDRLDTIDVLTIGGSTTNQQYLDDDATWQAQLVRRFAAEGRSVEVVNAGIDGQSTIGHLVAFDKCFLAIPGLKPHYVLAYIGINDTAVKGREHYEAMEPRSRLRRLSRFLKNNSAFYNLYRILRGWLRAREA